MPEVLSAKPAGEQLLQFLLRLLLRNDKAAFVEGVILLSLPQMLGFSWIGGIITLGISVLLIFLLMRFGLVAIVLSWVVYNLFQLNPITFDTSA